ncbi:formate--tetrahydrofolate ligase [Sutcliffiella rhizosphaerae]|uniref:Formate--tetrahydrofolate ligase n=1 Tax=Sutcliffiella rhizosphaerae TaxID=2880967 RepID=A0ABM8YPW6_9BACI|nr:formate--tetrahydrofolate ligase [Sutcliffiella rhizosphaerae]CAG9622019.1 Formate--tetrahydrofolate ligase 1 [Sutcliffiella rhizosphaerae]
MKRTKTAVPSDIEIAQQASMKKITEIVEQLDIEEEEIELYGKYKAKLSHNILNRLAQKENGKVILVTAINPTPAGEGKSTVTVGLGQALNKLGKKTVIAMREPSLGPTMGLKGGAAGGGYSQVLPMEDINLHFTGDIHAITTANNALAAMIDNHIHQGNELQIDTRRITWKRVVDLNDRALRKVVIGLGGATQGVPREDGFDITVASEIMAVFCLAKDLKDLKARLARIVIGYDVNQKPVTVKDLNVEGALTLLLKDASMPNLVQTMEHSPAIIHGGPFANIAHGCNSVLGTQMAAKLGDYVVTEAGFGADLGAEKFLHIKTPSLGYHPQAVVIVATVRAIKMHGGLSKDQLKMENLEALKLGIENVKKHVETIQSFGLPYVIALNEFVTDTEAEISYVQEWCKAHEIPMALTQVWEKGGEGGLKLAEAVLSEIEKSNDEFTPLYLPENTVEQKLEIIAKTVYGAEGVDILPTAQKQLQLIVGEGWGHLPICMAKTQYSLSDDAKKLGRPQNFTITIRELKPSVGAGFIVALTGNIMTMPGLPKEPAALKMDVDEQGKATGLF